jgi:predicted nucleotidyltransferase
MDNLPDFTAELIKDEIERQRGPVFDKAFSDIILHKLRMIEPERLREVPDVTEGLENRLISCAMQSGTLSDFIDRVSTSRYPSTRVKRIAMNLLWGITKDELRSFVSDETCGYLRVLGFSSNGRDLLARIHKEAGLPLITKVSEYRNLLSGLSRKMFEYDIKATNSYVLAFPAPAQRAGDQDFTMPIIKLN